MWTVYELVDPRDGEPFYVGCTSNTKARHLAHRTDPASAAYRRCREIKGEGLMVQMREVERFDDKIEARRKERDMILSNERLLNSRKFGMLSLVLYPL